MRHGVQVERPREHAVALFLAVVVPGDQAVFAAAQGALQRLGCEVDDVGQESSIEARDAVEDASACRIGEHDTLTMVEQQDGHRRALQQRIEEQFALDQLGALLAQHRAHAVEDVDQIADFVARGEREARREVALGEAQDAIVQRAQGAARPATSRREPRPAHRPASPAAPIAAAPSAGRPDRISSALPPIAIRPHSTLAISTRV